MVSLTPLPPAPVGAIRSRRGWPSCFAGMEIARETATALAGDVAGLYISGNPAGAASVITAMTH